MPMRIAVSLAGCALLTACASSSNQQETAASQGGAMSFFLTSAGSGKGADLGGLAGADRHCQDLAQAAGAG